MTAAANSSTIILSEAELIRNMCLSVWVSEQFMVLSLMTFPRCTAQYTHTLHQPCQHPTESVFHLLSAWIGNSVILGWVTVIIYYIRKMSVNFMLIGVNCSEKKKINEMLVKCLSGAINPFRRTSLEGFSPLMVLLQLQSIFQSCDK